MNLTDLKPNTTYYVRAYTTIAFQKDTTFYGNQIDFTTDPKEEKPTFEAFVITLGATSITATSATYTGVVRITLGNINQIDNIGFYCAKTSNPAISDNNDIFVEDYTIMDSQTITFKKNVTDLNFYTKYYVCAYIKTNGVLYYGNEIVFRTQLPPPQPDTIKKNR
jgi:hypothetical protein